MASSSSQPQGKRFKSSARKGAAPCPDIEESEVPSTDISRFLSPAQYNAFNQCCASRNVIIERLFDEDFLKSIEFPWVDRLEEWGWWSFMGCQRPVYPNLVRTFYFCGDNKIYDAEGNSTGREYDDRFTTIVLGKKLDIHARSIKKFIYRYLKDDGDRFIPTNYPFADFCKTVYQDPSIDYFEEKTSRMDLHTRILHLIVCQVLYPRGGNFAVATKQDIYIMAKIMMNDPPNLASLVIKHMLEAVKLSKSEQSTVGLPYGKLVSKICQYQNTLPKDEPIVTKGGLSIFNAKSVKQMGWNLDPVTKIWVKRGEQRAVEEEEEEEVTLGSIMDKVHGVNANLSNISDQMERMEARQESLETQILHVHNTIQAIHQNSPYTVPFPFFNPPQN